MNLRAFLALLVIALMLPHVNAGESGKRRKWDQKKAESIVRNILIQEQRGEFPWNNISWQTDPAKVAALAQNQRKPIFVYFFLKKNVGPAAAPC